VDIVIRQLGIKNMIIYMQENKYKIHNDFYCKNNFYNLKKENIIKIIEKENIIKIIEKENIIKIIEINFEPIFEPKNIFN
jgi:hypothetical protein